MYPELALRPATPDDIEFLHRLNRTTMRTYVEQLWDVWDDAWQRQRLLDRFDSVPYQIVTLAGQDIGAMWAERRAEEIFIGVIELMPEFQGRGIGAYLLKQVLDEGYRAGLPVKLQVLKANPARRLYERLGFAVIGETETHYQMKA